MEVKEGKMRLRTGELVPFSKGTESALDSNPIFTYDGYDRTWNETFSQDFELSFQVGITLWNK